MNQTADLTEKTLSREEKYQGNILSLHVDQVQLPNGKTSFREVVEHVDGVAILALDDRNNVLTVTQYRYVIGKTLLEIPAGKLEPGEDPFEAMKREQLEETGTTGKNYVSLGNLYPTPGYCGEIIRLWACRVDKETGELSLDPDEFLQTLRIPLDKAVEMAKMMNVPVLGLVENMSYVTCPDCGREIHVFGESHIDEVAAKYALPVLGKLPMEPKLAAACDRGAIELFEGGWLDGAADLIESLPQREL